MRIKKHTMSTTFQQNVDNIFSFSHTVYNFVENLLINKFYSFLQRRSSTSSPQKTGGYPALMNNLEKTGF